MKQKSFLKFLVIGQIGWLVSCSSPQDDTMNRYAELSAESVQAYKNAERSAQVPEPENEFSTTFDPAKAEKDMYKDVPSLDTYMNDQMLNADGSFKTSEDEKVPWYDEPLEEDGKSSDQNY